MTKEEIKKAIKIYQEFFDKKYENYPYGKTMLDEKKIPILGRDPCYLLYHANGMCEQILGLLEAGDLQEAIRQLGFLQGILWVLARKFSFDDLKKHLE